VRDFFIAQSQPAAAKKPRKAAASNVTPLRRRAQR